MRLDISIIIVNFNGSQWLRDCLESLNNMESAYTHEVIVVDNGSTDHSVHMMKNYFEEVSLLENVHNQGFAQACNQGARIAKGRYYIFLNTDTRVGKQSLDPLLAYMDEHDDVGVTGPQLYGDKDKKQNSVDQFPSLWTLACNKNVLRWVFPRTFPSKYKSCDDPTEVPSLVGACFCIRATTFKRMAGYDEVFFFYFEETDLCWRVWRSGQRIVLIPEAKVFHASGASAKKYPIVARIEYYRSLYLFLRRKGYGRIAMRYAKFFVCVRTLVNAIFNIGAWPKFKTYVGILFWHVKNCPVRPSLRWMGDELNGVEAKGAWHFLFNKKFSGTLRSVLEEEVMKDEWFDSHVIKKSDYRSVLKKTYHVKGQNITLYIKCYHHARWVDRLKTVFIGPKGLKEWTVSWGLKRRNISVPDPVLYARYMKKGVCLRDVFINVSVDGAREVLDMMNAWAGKTTQGRYIMTKRLAMFVADMHNQGFYHRDLHGGNILCHFDHRGIHYTVIDLHRSGFCSQLSFRKMMMNFAYLHASLRSFVSRSEALFFVKTYEHYRKQRIPRYRWYKDSLERLVENICADKKPFWRRYRIKGDSVEYGPKAEWLVGMKQQLPHAHKMVRKTEFINPDHILKLGQKFRVFRVRGHYGQVCCKEPVRSSPLLRGRLYMEWKKSLKLFWAGFPVARPLAYVYRKGVFMSQMLSAAKALDEYFYKDLPSNQKSQFIVALADFMASVHGSGLWHRDAKAANILVYEGRPRHWVFKFVDNGRVHILDQLDSKHIAHNITQLWASFPSGLRDVDLMLFLKYYGEENSFFRESVLNQYDHIKQTRIDRLVNAGYAEDQI